MQKEKVNMPRIDLDIVSKSNSFYNIHIGARAFVSPIDIYIYPRKSIIHLAPCLGRYFKRHVTDNIEDILIHESVHLVMHHIGERDASVQFDNLFGYVGDLESFCETGKCRKKI